MKTKEKTDKKQETYASVAARSRAIKKLADEGYNYFVLYTKNGKPALQFATSNSSWVKKRAKNGIYVSGAK